VTSELTIPCRYDQLPVLAEWIGQLAVAMSLPRTVAYRLDLVLAEAVTNIIEHGCTDIEGREIVIRCDREADGVAVEITDDARPYDPTAREEPASAAADLEAANPNGRGILLMRRYTREMRYRYENGRNLLTLILPLE
jgi:sigma-B regulation protein RsbU (phosphoserine phosphatase)